jgi:hypothetical protein
MFSILFIFLFTFYTPLHVSALMGHLQVEYTVTYGSYYAYNGSAFSLSKYCAYMFHNGPKLRTKLNSVARVRERTIPTERLPLVGEDSANFCG